MNESAIRPSRFKSQLRQAAIVVYATLGIGTFCIPTSVYDWAEQLHSESARAVLLPIANCIVSISKLSGADKPYLVARDLFLSATGKKDSDDAMDH
jgi:hypothetical protein